MRISLFSDYSLRVLMFGALKDESFSLQEVADSYQISRHHLVKVVNRLSHLGYLQTKRGRGGGIILGRPPASIRIGDLIRQTEQETSLVECFDPATNTCPIDGACHLKGILRSALDAFFDTLNRHTLADLVRPSLRRHLKPLLFTSNP